MNPSPVTKPRFWNYNRRRKLWWLFWIVVVLAPFVLFITAYRASKTTVEFTVDRRERVTTGSGDSVHSYYLVWTQEGEVFSVTDSWSFMRFDSSDRYGKLKEGHRFRAQVAGWRVGFLSWYRNAIDIEEIASPDAVPK